jgi:hypothetical protein
MLNFYVEWVLQGSDRKDWHLKATFGAREAWMLDRLVGLGRTVQRCGFFKTIRDDGGLPLDFSNR